MHPPITAHQPIATRPPIDEVHANIADPGWGLLYRIAGAAALISVGFIGVAVIVFIANPPPSTITEWFALFHKNAVIGLLDSDLIMLASFVLMSVIYLALYGALRRANEPFMLLALISGVTSVVTYVAANPAFSMLALSSQYARASSEAERLQVVAAGQAAITNWQGSAFDVSYLLAAIAMLIIAAVMLRSSLFGKATASFGLLVGILGLVPATAGVVGIVFSLISLVPTTVWLILIARRFLQLGSTS